MELKSTHIKKMNTYHRVIRQQKSSCNFSITLGIAIFLFIKSWTQGLESAIVNS